MPLDDLVTPLTRRTLSADVHAQLRELLMSGRLMPGEAISLRHVAAALGVSVMPVREAVHRLVAEQALELTPQRVLRVPRMTAAQFREITRIRVNLEGMATAQAARAVDDAGLREIESLHGAFAREMARPRPDGARLIALNKDLHFAVYRAAAMPTLLQLIEALWLRVGPILNHDLRAAGSERVTQRTAVAHHSRLVDALQRRHAAQASAALRGDIESAADFILAAGVLVASDTPQPVPAASEHLPERTVAGRARAGARARRAAAG